MEEEKGFGIVNSFKEKTEMVFHGIDDFTVSDIEDTVEAYLQDKIASYGIIASIVGIAIVGSRCRGLERAESDLDVVVELLTDWREDVLFDIFHEDDLCVSGVLVDINPITRQRTGTLVQYLPRAEAYLAQHARIRSM